MTQPSASKTKFRLSAKRQVVGLLGAGTWGTTLSTILSKKRYEIRLWEYCEDVAKSVREKRILKTLPWLKIPKKIFVTSDMTEIIPADLIVIAVPSFAFRETLKKLKAAGAVENPSLVIATKGFEISTAKTLSQVAKDEFPKAKSAVLSGPSHAEEVSKEIPTAITAASEDESLTKWIQKIFSTENFRVYTNTDLRGVELAGALKNIYAIAAGICDGLGLGDNTKAALVTRALNEMVRLGVLMGGRVETFIGLAGAGDLIVTCYSRHSRNRAVGEMIGKGANFSAALKRVSMVAEGIYAVKAINRIRGKLKVELPILTEVYNILYNNKPPRKSITTLMTRPLKNE